MSIRSFYLYSYTSYELNKSLLSLQYDLGNVFGVISINYYYSEAS